MNKILRYASLSLLLILVLIETGLCCFSAEQITNLDQIKVEEIYSHLVESTKADRDKYFTCRRDSGIYQLEENILKSKSLSDTQKLEYYYEIFRLYPNNAEMGSVLGYDIIKILMKHKKQPLKQSVELIQDQKLKIYIRESLIDADLLTD